MKKPLTKKEEKRIADILAEPIKYMTEDEIQDVEVTCCNVEITQEIKEVGLCPKCLEHI